MTTDFGRFRSLAVLIRTAIAALCLLACGVSASAQDDDYLPPASEVFKYTTQRRGDQVVVTYTIAPNHYLYHSRMSFATDTPGVTLGQAQFPEGRMHEDDNFGKQEIYVDRAIITVPFTVTGARPAAFVLILKLQGCNEKRGICYPPQVWPTTIALAPSAGSAGGSALPMGKPVKSGGATNRLTGDILPVDQAFQLSADVTAPERIKLTWVIAQGHYLYRAKISVATKSALIALGAPAFPAAETLTDESLGQQEIYRGVLDVEVPFSRGRAAGGKVDLDVSYQGCAEGRICYPLETKTVSVDIPNGSAAPAGEVAEQDQLAAAISGPLVKALFWFFLGGLVLSLTPCVLPMIPILSGIIVSQGKDTSSARAFSLSVVYVLGMALTYAAAGAVFALAGKQAQAAFQQTWVIVTFAALFVFLSLPMFGLFELQMPSFIQTRVARASNQQKSGTLLGTFVMGVLSSLIVTTCVAPPLVGALTYIAQTADVMRGALALFSMGIGMGVPLLIVGASAGRLLPKSGPWMVNIKAFFGVLFLGVAVYLLDRALPAVVVMVLWAILAFASGYWLWTLGRVRDGGGNVVVAALGLLLMLYGSILAVGAAAGRTDPLQPLHGLATSAKDSKPTQSADGNERFVMVKTSAELDSMLAAAKAAGRPALVDFYADWCTSCKELEKYTFADNEVIKALTPADLIRVDVTNDSDLLTRFGLVGPPTILFFDRNGTELKAQRIVGYVKADRFRELATTAFSTGA